MPPPLELHTDVPATRAEVYRAWTTTEGTRTFFAPRTNVELKVGGAYEITFDPNDPTQGTQGCKTLAWLRDEMVAFEWVAPPELRAKGAAKTFVVITLSDAPQGGTRVKLVQDGWGECSACREQAAYFHSAWPMVLSWLRQRFASGPLDWKQMEQEARAGK